MPIVLQFKISEEANPPGMGISLDIDIEDNSTDHEIRLRRDILDAVNEVIWKDVEQNLNPEDVDKVRQLFFPAEGGLIT